MRRLAALLLIFAARAEAAPADEVLWHLPEFPPVFITGSALQGQGYGDGELRYLTSPEPAPQDSHVACSKGAVGRKVITAIDALLASDEAMAEYVGNLRDWYSPAEFEIAQKLAHSTGK